LKSFGHGVKEGVKGMVASPVAGAQEEGAKGFFKGIAKGTAG